MTIEDMKRRKQELGYSLEKISELSGVPLGTVMKIFGGVTKSPRYETIRALEAVLIPKDAFSYTYQGPAPSYLREDSPAYASTPRKKFTVDDYYALPDDDRAELIDGVFYDMSSPSIMHQVILSELVAQFHDCARKHGMGCQVLPAPCDVQLNVDKYTMVQPDLLIVCDKGKLRKNVCMGAPDLTLEIMSAFSRSRDSVLKLHKYKQAGVREYWLIDPESQTVITYRFENGNTFDCYSFREKIPVGISEGSCLIDFSIIDDEIREIGELQGEVQSSKPNE